MANRKMRHLTLLFLLTTVQCYSQIIKPHPVVLSVSVYATFIGGADFEIVEQGQFYTLNYNLSHSPQFYTSKGVDIDSAQAASVVQLLKLLEVSELKRITTVDVTDGTRVDGYINKGNGQTKFFSSFSGYKPEDHLQKETLKLVFKLTLTYLQSKVEANRQLGPIATKMEDLLAINLLKDIQAHALE